MSTTSDAIVMIVVALVGMASVAIDLRTRRIPNGLTFSAALAGVALAAADRSGLSIGASLVGMGLGLALMLPGHLLGGTGGGDVKLVAALGAILGPNRIVATFLYSAIAGGVIALGYAAARGRLRRTVTGAAQIAAGNADSRNAVAAPESNNRFPYAPAIAAGSLLAALGL